MKKLGCAVQGAGWVAAEHIRSYLNNPNCELKAINSRLQSELDEKKALFNLDCDLYLNSYQEMLARDDIDVVSICTISFLHVKEAIQAARAGKNVLIEKPIAITLDELRDLRDEVAKSGARAIAGFVLHWNPLMKIIKEIMRAGDLGDIFYIASDYWHEVFGEWKSKRKTSGNTLLMGGCHSIDALRWFMEGDEVVEVTGLTAEPRRRFDFDFPPTAAALLKFQSGAIGKVACSLECNMPYVFNIEIMGSKGTLMNNRLYCDKFKGQTGWMEIPTLLPDKWEVAHHPFQGEIDDFIQCILEGRTPETSVADAWKTHEICIAAEMSAQEGRPIKLPLI